MVDLPQNVLIQLTLLLLSHRDGMMHEIVHLTDAVQREAAIDEIAEIGNRMIALNNRIRGKVKALVEPHVPTLN